MEINESEFVIQTGNKLIVLENVETMFITNTGKIIFYMKSGKEQSLDVDCFENIGEARNTYKKISETLTTIQKLKYNGKSGKTLFGR